MLPPQPLPDMPQGAEPPPPLLALFPDCFLALFFFGWDCCFWSCGLLLRSNVCVQPRVTRNREQKSARRKRFFFTGPPLSESQREHVGPGPRRYLDLAKAACRTGGSSSVLMLFPDAIFRPGDSFAAETPGKSPNSENPDTTWQTPLLFLESKSLLEQNCCRLAASQ